MRGRPFGYPWSRLLLAATIAVLMFVSWSHLGQRGGMGINESASQTRSGVGFTTERHLAESYARTYGG